MRRFAVLPVFAIVLATSACSADVEVLDSPYRAEFDVALARVTTEFERSVLGDGVITDAEYAEAQQRYVACVEDQGYSLEVRAAPNGDPIYEFDTGLPPDDSFEEARAAAFAAYDDCGLVTVAEIEPLKRAIEANPQNVDRAQAIIDCLVDAEVAPQGATAEDLETYLAVDGTDPGDPLTARVDAIDECVSSAAK